MYALIAVFLLNGAPVDVDVIGEANSPKMCDSMAHAFLPQEVAALPEEVTIVIKCAEKEHLPNSYAEFDKLPTSARGHGTHGHIGK